MEYNFYIRRFVLEKIDSMIEILKRIHLVRMHRTCFSAYRISLWVHISVYVYIYRVE